MKTYTIVFAYANGVEDSTTVDAENVKDAKAEFHRNFPNCKIKSITFLEVASVV